MRSMQQQLLPTYMASCATILEPSYTPLRTHQTHSTCIKIFDLGGRIWETRNSVPTQKAWLEKSHGKNGSIGEYWADNMQIDLNNKVTTSECGRVH